MPRPAMLLMLPLVIAAAGCNCLGAAAYRPLPMPGIRERLTLPGPNEAPASPVLFSQNAAATFGAGDDAAARPSQSQTPYRHPQTAFCLACIAPGGGHLYTGETVKGVALLGIAAGGLIGGAMLSSGGDEFGECEYNPETFECEPAGGSMPLLIGAAIAAGSWVYGIIDSRPSAGRMNERNGHQVGNARIDLRPWVGMRSGRASGGLFVRVTRLGS